MMMDEGSERCFIPENRHRQPGLISQVPTPGALCLAVSCQQRVADSAAPYLRPQQVLVSHMMLHDASRVAKILACARAKPPAPSPKDLS